MEVEGRAYEDQQFARSQDGCTSFVRLPKWGRVASSEGGGSRRRQGHARTGSRFVGGVESAAGQSVRRGGRGEGRHGQRQLMGH